MLTVSHIDLWHELSEDEEETLSAADRAAIRAMDIKQIVVDFSMSENHIGGDDVCDIVHDTLEAVKAGYEIVVWYGPDTEVLIIGVRPGSLKLVD